jgi:hypothetical protein
MRRAGEQAANGIRERTRRGIDEDGRPFAPGADGQRVDMSASGRMLNDLTVLEATNYSLKIGFKTDPSARIAALHDAGTSRMPSRRFLGLSAAMVDGLVRFLKARLGQR